MFFLTLWSLGLLFSQENFEWVQSALKMRYTAFFPKDAAQNQKPWTYRVAIATMFQNEAPYLKEWIEFHRLVGVEHFYLYNHRSEDHYLEILSPYIQEGIVELVDWHWPSYEERQVVKGQTAAFNDALSRTRGKVQWLALIDADEFIVPAEQKNLIDFLKQYERYAAVAVSWQQFGTSEIESLSPHEAMLEKLTRKAPVKWPGNWMVKSIVRPDCVLECIDPHFCAFKEGFVQVNEEGIPFCGSIFPLPEGKKIRINHYWTRDKRFMEQIKARRKDGHAALLYQERKELLNALEDDSIARFLPALKERLYP